MSLIFGHPGTPAPKVTYRYGNSLGTFRKVTMTTMVTMLNRLLVAN